MASVRMTNELRADIRRAAERTYEKAHPTPKPSTECADLIKNAALRSNKQMYLQKCIDLAKEMNITNDEYLPTVKNINELEVRKLLDNDERRQGYRDYHSFSVQFSTPINWLRAANNSSWYTPDVKVTDLPLDTQTAVIEKFNEFIEIRTAHNKAKQEYNDSITDLLNECTTLKQLLEIWPGAESLVPEAKLQKMHTKVTRKERAEKIKEEICFDPSIANQTVLTAKLMGG